MPLPTPLSRRKRDVHKNSFGHVFVLAGSKEMLGAAALCSLAAMRSGAGLVTLGIPQSLNSVAQKKISNVVMTLALEETREQTLSLKAFSKIQSQFTKCDSIAIGPGLSQHPSTQKLILKVIQTSPVPVVIDADALNALCEHLQVLVQSKTDLILTPHPGEMMRLLNRHKPIETQDRKAVVEQFVRKYPVTLLLKGHHTLVAQKGRTTYINKTGNAGMATAGSGDVLTGMIAAFVAQGMDSFEATRFGAYLHGLAGDLAAKNGSQTSMIASDLIDSIAPAIKQTDQSKR